MLMDKAAILEFVVEVVRKLEDRHTLLPLRRRRIVERSFGWMMKSVAWCAIMNGVSTSLDN
jgi:hypothetical protein